MLSKQQNALLLYVDQGLAAQTVAEIVGVSRNTLNKWVKQGNWKQLREKNLYAPAAILQACYEISRNISDRMRNEGASQPGDLEALNKLAAIIHKFDKKRSTVNDLNILMDLNNYMAQVDIEFTRKLIPYQKEFVRDRLNTEEKAQIK